MNFYKQSLKIIFQYCKSSHLKFSKAERKKLKAETSFIIVVVWSFLKARRKYTQNPLRLRSIYRERERGKMKAYDDDDEDKRTRSSCINKNSNDILHYCRCLPFFIAWENCQKVYKVILLMMQNDALPILRLFFCLRYAPRSALNCSIKVY